jgi:tetratricopeptide (TPR) repeat protein
VVDVATVFAIIFVFYGAKTMESWGCRWSIMSTIAMVALVQSVAVAETSQAINQIAQAITVKIAYGNGNGSGILLRKDGDVYTVLTAAHVVKGKPENQLKLTASDDQQYQVIPGSVKQYAGDIDLAVVKFRSAKNYPLANLGNSNSLTGGMELYVAGFPAPTAVITESIFVFQEGKVVANSKRGFKEGYALLYSNSTLPGMSGGPVLNGSGQVVGIHGKGDRERQTGEKTGFNAGVPIARFADIATNLGVDLDTRVARTVQSPVLTADDYFLLANQKNEQGNYPDALANYNQAIAINSNFAEAYNNRGILKGNKLNDFAGALSDYNQAISLNFNYPEAYLNRGVLKKQRLNNFAGALADYTQAIALLEGTAQARDFDLGTAYYNRGNLKSENLNDPQGALADYDKAIALNPSDADAYFNRGNLKKDNLNDPNGALADYDRAIALSPNNAFIYSSRGSVKYQKLNSLAAALQDFSDGIRLNPSSVDIIYNRGDFFYMNDRKAEALKDFRTIRELAAEGLASLVASGVIAMEAGQLDLAISSFDRAIAAEPKFGDAFKYRGLAYNRRGNRTQATQDWRTAAQLSLASGADADYRSIQRWLQVAGAN